MRSGIILASLVGAVLAASTAAASAAPTWCAQQGSKNAAERTICATRSLWTLDDELNDAYSGAERNVGSQKSQLKASQANWLRATRDACGGNVSCLTRVYRARIATLDDIKNRGRM